MFFLNCYNMVSFYLSAYCLYLSPIHFHSAAMMIILNSIILQFFILKPFNGFLSLVRFSLDLHPPCTLTLTRLSHASGSFSARHLLWPGVLLSSPVPCPSGLTDFLYLSWFCEPGLSGISLYNYSPHYSPFCSIYDMILPIVWSQIFISWRAQTDSLLFLTQHLAHGLACKGLSNVWAINELIWEFLKNTVILLITSHFLLDTWDSFQRQESVYKMRLIYGSALNSPVKMLQSMKFSQRATLAHYWRSSLWLLSKLL